MRGGFELVAELRERKESLTEFEPFELFVALSSPVSIAPAESPSPATDLVALLLLAPTVESILPSPADSLDDGSDASSRLTQKYAAIAIATITRKANAKMTVFDESSCLRYELAACLRRRFCDSSRSVVSFEQATKKVLTLCFRFAVLSVLLPEPLETEFVSLEVASLEESVESSVSVSEGEGLRVECFARDGAIPVGKGKRERRGEEFKGRPLRTCSADHSEGLCV